MEDRPQTIVFVLEAADSTDRFQAAQMRLRRVHFCVERFSIVNQEMLQLKIQNVADEFTSRAAVRNFECSAWQPDLRLLWNTSMLQRQRTTSDFRLLISAARICDRAAGLFTSLAVGMLAEASGTHHADRITDLRFCRAARFARSRLGVVLDNLRDRFGLAPLSTGQFLRVCCS